MTKPAFGRRDAQPLLDRIGDMNVLDSINGLFGERVTGQPDQLAPSDAVARMLALSLRTAQTRDVLEWLMDITFRAPFRATGATIEETALLAATRQGIEGVGEVILAAIARGQAILEQEEKSR